jgi:hypothetical protein
LRGISVDSQYFYSTDYVGNSIAAPFDTVPPASLAGAGVRVVQVYAHPSSVLLKMLRVAVFERAENIEKHPKQLNITANLLLL